MAKYDSDIVGWYTRGGKRIPIRSGGKSGEKSEKGSGEKKGSEEKSHRAFFNDKKQGRYYKDYKNKDEMDKDIAEETKKKGVSLITSDQRFAPDKESKKEKVNLEKVKKDKKVGEVKKGIKEDKKNSSLSEEDKKVREKARGFVDKAKEKEPQITKDVKDSLEGTKASVEKGLPYRLKEEDSLAKKLKSKFASKGWEYEPEDVVRYTALSDEENLTADYFKIKENLEDKGYELVESTNTLHVDGAVYKAINANFRTPEGYVFEYQFNTPIGAEIKEINHKIYKPKDENGNEMRFEDLPKDKQDEYYAIMVKNAEKVVEPKDIRRINDIKKGEYSPSEKAIRRVMEDTGFSRIDAIKYLREQQEGRDVEDDLQTMRELWY